MLEYSRSHASDTDVPWISTSNPNYWSDGLVILAVAPEARKVGCYFGEDVAVPLEQQAAIQDAAKDQYRRADWYETTELMAAAIPEDEPHGAQVMARYRWFLDEYEEVTRSWMEFGNPHGAQWFGRSSFKRATELEKRSEGLDSLDDVIANTATFLSRSHGWDRVWSNEQGPVLEELQSLRRLCQQIDSSVVANRGAIPERSKEERDWVHSCKQRLDVMTSDLENGSLQPSAALDEFDEIADETKTRAARLAREAIDADTSRYGDERRRRYDSRSSKDAFYAGYWYLGGGHGSYNPHSTIRLNPSSPAVSAFGSSGSGSGGSYSSFTPVSDLVVGYSTASSYTPSSSSGAGFSGSSFSGGYSGGGFSGSGSSSSF